MRKNDFLTDVLKTNAPNKEHSELMKTFLFNAF